MRRLAQKNKICDDRHITDAVFLVHAVVKPLRIHPNFHK